MGCCSSKPAPGDLVSSTENFRDGYTAPAKVDAPAPMAMSSELSSTYRHREVGSVNAAEKQQLLLQTRDPSGSGQVHESPKKQEQVIAPPCVGKQREGKDTSEGNGDTSAEAQEATECSVGAEEAKKKSLAPSGPDKPVPSARRQRQQSDTVGKRGADRSRRNGSSSPRNWMPSILLQAPAAGPAVAVLQGMKASVGAARSHRRRLEQLYGLCEVAVNSLVQACLSLSPSPSQATTAVDERLVNPAFWRDAHDGLGSAAVSSAVSAAAAAAQAQAAAGKAGPAAAAAAAAAASAAVTPPTTPRHLRAAAEALAAELVKVTALADSWSPRGVLERLGAAWVSSEALLGVWGRGEMKEEGVEFDATEDRLRYILGRINETLESREGKGVKGAPVNFLRRGRSVEEPFCFERRLDEGGDWARLEAFRREFVEKVEEAGGLRDLVVSWNEAGRLEAAFKAWVGEPSNTGQVPPNLKAEIERVASLVEALADPPLSQQQQQQRQHLQQPQPQPQQRSPRSPRPHPASTTPPAIPNGSSNNSGAKKKVEEDIHRPLPRTAEPPIGAPLRPRHYVCRERLSSLAAAALLRGSGTREGSGTTVVFAGSSGAGKACLAAEVVGRRDVRAKFGGAVVWLQVGRTGGADPAIFLRRLAHAYHKVVLSKLLRQPPSPPPIERFRVSKTGTGDNGGSTTPTTSAGTTVPGEMEGVGGSDAEATTTTTTSNGNSWFVPYTVGLGLRCLVVLEDVSDPEVVACASAAGFDVVVTTGVRDLLPNCPPLCTRLEVGGLSMEEARSLLRRCSGLDSQAALPPSADSVIKACGALALPLAIAGSLPAVRCRSDEAAWSNLYSILSHKATRLGESRGTTSTNSSSSGSGSGIINGSSSSSGSGSSREHRRGRSSTSVPIMTSMVSSSSNGTGGEGSGGGTSGGVGVVGKGSMASSSGGGGGAGGSGTESVGSAAAGQSSPLLGSGSVGNSGGKDSSEPPPWVGAVLWASLHALPQGHADQYLALAALPSCLRGAPGATPSAAGAKGAAGGAGIPHLAALWSIAGVGGTGGSIGGAGAGSGGDATGTINDNSNSADGVYDEEEAKASVEMLVSRSLLLLRRSAAVVVPVAGAGGGAGVKSVTEEAQQLLLSSASTRSRSRSSSPSNSSSNASAALPACVNPNTATTTSKISDCNGEDDGEDCSNNVGDDAGGNNVGVRSRGSSYWEHGRVGGEGQRYAMHALQAAYVRSAARQRLDLMKTLGPRREAALGVVGEDGVSAAEAAAQEAAASGGTSRGSSPGRVYLRDAALLAKDSSNGRGSGGIHTPRSLGHSSVASSTTGRGTNTARGPSPMGTPAAGGGRRYEGSRPSPATLAAAVAEATCTGGGSGSRVGVSSSASPETTACDSSSSQGFNVGGGNRSGSDASGRGVFVKGVGVSSAIMGHGDGGCYSSSLDGEGSDTSQESCTKEAEAEAAEAVTAKEAMAARGAMAAGEAPVAWAWPGETGWSKFGRPGGFGFGVGGRGGGGRLERRPDVNQRLVAARGTMTQAARGMVVPPETPGTGTGTGSGSGSGSGTDTGTNLGVPEAVPGTASTSSSRIVRGNGSGFRTGSGTVFRTSSGTVPRNDSKTSPGMRLGTVPETVRESGSGNGGGSAGVRKDSSGRAGYAAPLAGRSATSTAMVTAKRGEHHAAAAAAAAAAADAAADVAAAAAAAACEEAEGRSKELRRNNVMAPVKATRAFAVPPRPIRRANSTASGSSTYSYSTGSENGSGVGAGLREEATAGGSGGGGVSGSATSIAREATSTPGRPSSEHRKTPRMVQSVDRDRRPRFRRETERTGSSNSNHHHNHSITTTTTTTGSTSSRASSTTSGGSTSSRTSGSRRRHGGGGDHFVEGEESVSMMGRGEKEAAVDRDSDSALLDGGAGGGGGEITAEKRRRQQRRQKRRQERLQQQQHVMGTSSSSSSSRHHGRGGWEDRSEEQKTKAALEDALDSTTLGDLWFERGELDEARHEHMRALKIRTARLRHGHPDIAESLESLGNVAIREGNHLEAEGLHRRALEMRTRELGPSHLDVAATLNNLAVSLKGQPGRLPEAEAVCAHALSIVEENEERGMKAPNLKAALLKLKSKVIKRLGRRVEAADLRAKAIAIMQAAAEPSTPGAPDVAPKP